MKNENAFRNNVKRLKEVLEKYRDFFDSQYRFQIDGEVERFEKACAMNADEAKTLRIGIVGAMKAGKSSFLNMLLFDGKEVLPRAATPMTAALTRITHSADKDCHITVYFYERKDWAQIEEKAADYDKKLAEHYEKYKNDLERQNQACMTAARGTAPKLCEPMSIKQYEQKIFSNEKSVNDFIRAAKELVVKYGSAVGLEDLLGRQKHLDGSNLCELLEPYVGADGTFTPIVNYVELSIPSREMEGFEIVDMPGLGDPITSRSDKTKEFVKDCDAVLYFFSGVMHGSDIAMLTRMLPSAGIENGIVIASRFDESVTSYRGKMSLAAAVQRAKADAKQGYSEAVQQMSPLLQRGFSQDRLLFTSALADSVNRKKHRGIDLTEDEQANYGNLVKMNGGKELSSAELASLSGLKSVKMALNEIMEGKESLLRDKEAKKIRSAQESVQRILVQLLEHVQNVTGKVEEGDVEEAKRKKVEVERALDSSAARIGSHFDAAALSARKAIGQLDAELLGEPENFVDLKVDSKVNPHHEKRHEGFLGLRTTYYDYTVTTYSLATAQIDEKILSFASYCAQRVNERFEVIVDTDRLKRAVTDEVLAALKDASFTEEDVLAPLRIAFAKIKLPKLVIDPHEYLDKVHSEYPEGVAKGDDIHRARALLVSLLSDVQQDISGKLDANKEEIASVLGKESSGFTTELRARMSGELDRLQAECADKEKNLAIRHKFIDELHHIQELMGE